MKWINNVLDEVAKFLTDFGKGLLLASVGAVLFGKVENYWLLIGSILLAICSVLLGFYLANLFRQKEERNK